MRTLPLLTQMSQKRYSFFQQPSLIQCYLLGTVPVLRRHSINTCRIYCFTLTILPKWFLVSLPSNRQIQWAFEGLFLNRFVFNSVILLNFLCSNFSPLGFCDTVHFLVFLVIFCCCCASIGPSLTSLYSLNVVSQNLPLTHYSCSTPMSQNVVPGRAASAINWELVRNAVSWHPPREWETSRKFNIHLWF